MQDMSSISLAQGADSTMFTNMRGLLQPVFPYGTEQHVINDQDEHTVIRYGTQCSFRGRVVRIIMHYYIFIFLFYYPMLYDAGSLLMWSTRNGSRPDNL
jgi:hypothetical protein